MKFLESGKMQKVPWGVFAGICFIALFWLTAGVIAAYIITNAVAEATNSSVGLFDNWYQTLLFVLDVVFILLFAVCVVLFALKRRYKSSAAAQNRGGAEK